MSLDSPPFLDHVLLIGVRKFDRVTSWPTKNHKAFPKKYAKVDQISGLPQTLVEVAGMEGLLTAYSSCKASAITTVQNPTLEKIRSEIKALKKRVGKTKNARVLVAIGTHGVPEGLIFKDGFMTKKEWSESLASLKAKSLCVVQDTCHSGGSPLKGMGAPGEARPPNAEAFAYLSAVLEKEAAADGLFTPTIMAGLAGAARSRAHRSYVTASSLTDYIRAAFQPLAATTDFHPDLILRTQASFPLVKFPEDEEEKEKHEAQDAAIYQEVKEKFLIYGRPSYLTFMAASSLDAKDLHSFMQWLGENEWDKKIPKKERQRCLTHIESFTNPFAGAVGYAGCSQSNLTTTSSQKTSQTTSQKTKTTRTSTQEHKPCLKPPSFTAKDAIREGAKATIAGVVIRETAKAIAKETQKKFIEAAAKETFKVVFKETMPKQAFSLATKNVAGAAARSIGQQAGKIVMQKTVETTSKQAADLLVKQGGNLVVIKSSQETAKAIVKEGSKKTAASALKTTAIVGAVVETGFVVYDLIKDIKDPKKTEEEVLVNLGKNSVKAASRVGGAVIGQALIPIPVVGGVIGSLVGGWLGGLLVD